MFSKQVMTVIVLVTVCSWSVVMAVLGQVAAIAALVPSLGLLVQQILKAFTGAEPVRDTGVPPVPGQDDGRIG